MQTLRLSAIACCFVLASASMAKEPPIVDRAKYFSPAAVERAHEVIQDLQRKHHFDVRIESFESAPDHQAAKVQKMSARERGEFFADWLKSLAQESKAEGVLVLICRDPSHLRMGVSKALHQRGFTDADRDAALQPLLSAFKEKDYDRGLTESLTILSEKARHLKAGGLLSAGTRPRAAQPPSAPFAFGAGGWLCLGMGGLMVVLLLVSVVSSLFRGSAGGSMAPGGYGGGSGGGGWGGGMFGSLLTGLGGAMLGNWVYDQFSGRSAHAGFPQDSTGVAGPQDDGYQDFSSGGGDVGDSSGGDFGGDAGGGDFGGDSGGDGGGDF